MGNSHSSGGLSGKEESRAKQRFKQVTAKGQPYLTREKFNDLLGHSSCAQGLFKYVDADGDGTVSFKEIREEIKAFRSMNTLDSKLRVLYNYYDSNHDGKISRSEVADAMRIACGQELSNPQLEQPIEIVEHTAKEESVFSRFVPHNTSLVNSTMETFHQGHSPPLPLDSGCRTIGL